MTQRARIEVNYSPLTLGLKHIHFERWTIGAFQCLLVHSAHLVDCFAATANTTTTAKMLGKKKCISTHEWIQTAAIIL